MQTKTILKILVAILAGAYFLNYAFQPTGWIFLNNADLLIHEAGHVIFYPFGDFMHVLGGSLNQVLVPLMFVIYFYINRQFYSAAIILFWVGENLIYVSIYAGDAVKLQLPLLGGDSSTHDWNWLLSYTHQLNHTDQIAGFIRGLGILTIIGAMVWAILSASHKEVDIHYEKTY